MIIRLDHFIYGTTFLNADTYNKITFRPRSISFYNGDIEHVYYRHEFEEGVLEKLEAYLNTKADAYV